MTVPKIVMEIIAHVYDLPWLQWSGSLTSMTVP
jgi:hypothetical protein